MAAINNALAPAAQNMTSRQIVIHKCARLAIIARRLTDARLPPMKNNLIAAAELDRLDTWAKYTSDMCHSCMSSCCTLPVEVRIGDLIRIGVVDDFERGEPPKNIAKRLQKEGIVERFNQKSGIFTLIRMSNNDCLYLDRKTRLCTIYDKRPDTCRNHPKIGPRPGYCAYIPKALS
jgi:Fe-S-cluster containining protein